MKDEQIYFTGEYRRNAYGLSLITVIIGFLVIFALGQAGRAALVGGKLTEFLALIIPVLALSILPVKKIFRKREVRVSDSGILYGEMLQNWSKIESFKPLQQFARDDRKFHLLFTYKRFGTVSVMIPLKNPLTEGEYDSLADDLEKHVKSLYPALEIQRLNP